MKPLKIAIVGWAQSVHIQRWSQGLAKMGYQVRVVSLGDGTIDGVETININRSGRLSYLTQKSNAVRAIRQFEPDIVHAHYATGNAWWGIKSGARPLVISVWGSDVISFPSNPITKAISSYLLSKADRICATNQLLKERAVVLTNTASDKTVVIPFGVNVPDQMSPYPEADQFRICFVKALTKVYGPDLLIRAFAEALKTIPKMQLSLAGDGPMRGELERLSEQSGIADRVRFVGKIPYEQVYPFIQAHHLMAMPSRSESFGVAVLEAGACARPVLATNVGGVPELLEHEKNGLLVPTENVTALADGITKLAQDRNLSQHLGRNGYRLVKERFSWDESLARMSALYQSLV